MGGFGSGRRCGRPTVESAWKLDIDAMIRRRIIQPGRHAGGVMTIQCGSDEFWMKFDALLADPWDSWVRLRYVISDYRTDEKHEIDDTIYLATSQPRFGGQRWWFVCPTENVRVRKLYLPLGGRRFRSRHVYRLAYASRSMGRIDRAHRGQAKINSRLCSRGGFDPDDWSFPPKPKWMRWRTYNHAEEKFDRYQAILDEGTCELMAKLLGAGFRI
jgi:hypothetical protein